MCVNVPSKVLLPPTSALVFTIYLVILFSRRRVGGRAFKGSLNHNSLHGERERKLEHLRLKLAANTSITMMIETAPIVRVVKGTYTFLIGKVLQRM